MEIKKAIRHSVNMIMSISGVSGSGKTYTGLLLAAGLAGPGGKVGFLDTENGRGCMYADSPGIMAALPQGYDTIELSAPFHPLRYIEAIDEFERAGHNVLVIDSGSHAWEGSGGCTDIAEKDKGRWNGAKLANKRLVSRLLNSPMHIVVCLRAREKSKIIPAANGKKEEVISLGILPVSEKNFPYEMLLSFFVEEKTHLATQVKCPEPLLSLFPAPKLLTKEDGERIREWNDGAPQMNPMEKVFRRARDAAEGGLKAYMDLFGSLTPAQKKALVSGPHAANKALAEQADFDAEQARMQDLEATKEAEAA
jgi:AAA domain